MAFYVTRVAGFATSCIFIKITAPIERLHIASRRSAWYVEYGGFCYLLWSARGCILGRGFSGGRCPAPLKHAPRAGGLTKFCESVGESAAARENTARSLAKWIRSHVMIVLCAWHHCCIWLLCRAFAICLLLFSHFHHWFFVIFILRLNVALMRILKKIQAQTTSCNASKDLYRGSDETKRSRK